MKKHKVNVLGVTYTVDMVPRDKVPDGYEDAYGWCDYYNKEIHLLDVDLGDLANPEIFTNRIIRHELMHAFMHESGLDVCSTFALDETLIDFLALQMPKIFKAMNELKIL